MRVRGDEVVRVLPFLLWLSEEFPLRGTGPRRAASHAQAYLCIFQFLELKPQLVSVYVVDIYLQMCFRHDGVALCPTLGKPCARFEDSLPKSCRC